MTADVGVPFPVRLQQLAAHRGDHRAVITLARDGTVHALTFAELDGRANQWGRALASVGAELGSLVALAIPNGEDLILAALGCWKIGAVPVPMHWDLPDWERSRVLAAINPAVTLDDAGRHAVVGCAARQADDPLPAAISPTVNGICSSGSSGLPKVILNVAPAVWTPRHSEPFLAHWTPVPRPQTVLVPGPLYHTNGFATLTSLLGGDCLVVLEKFDAAMVVGAIKTYRVTTFTATPTMLARLAALSGISRRDFATVKWILQGAAVMPPALLRTWFGLLSPEQVVMAYGMTENLGLTALRGDEWLAHEGSVGRGFRGTEVRILDPRGGALGAGELGDIYLHAPMSAGYRYLGGAPALPGTPDGFRSVGDVGYLDPDGYLYVVDRRSDMIISGGANVFPAEVECALADLPAVSDVVVIGLTDRQWGQRVHAVVQPADPALTEDQVISYAKSRLAAYKVPKSVEFVDEIPRTAATKVNRSAMSAARGG